MVNRRQKVSTAHVFFGPYTNPVSGWLAPLAQSMAWTLCTLIERWLQQQLHLEVCHVPFSATWP